MGTLGLSAMRSSNQVVLLVLLVWVTEQAQSKEWKSKPFISKEKDKLAQWAEQQRKSVYTKSPKVKPKKTEGFKLKSIVEKEPEEVTIIKDHQSSNRESNDEVRRLCLSLSQESLPDFFLKFGLMTSLVSDVNEFKRKMKITDQSWRRQRFRGGDWSTRRTGGGQSERGVQGAPGGDKYFLKNKKDRIRNKPLRHNYLNGRARNDEANLNMCYGYRYLSAIDALDAASDGLQPDVSSMQESLSDMDNMKLSEELANIFQTCVDDGKKLGAGCPKITVSSSSTCLNNCVSSRECASNELCCPSNCGGQSCVNPSIVNKYRSANIKKNRCYLADRFMQCLHRNIKQKICEDPTF